MKRKEWKVYYEGNFWGHHNRDHAGKEIPLHRQFNWAGYHWVIPAAYSCGKGLVMDFCMRVETEKIRSFMERWNLTRENDCCDRFTSEQQQMIELENPLCFHFTPKLLLNGENVKVSHGCAICYNPCLKDEDYNEPEIMEIIEHYRLDPSYGWVICRSAFPWQRKRRPEITSLSLTMEQQPDQVPGPHFKVQAPGDQCVFFHPVSGDRYTLTVQELEQQKLPSDRLGFEGWIYPDHFIAMSYTLSPDPEERIIVRDCETSDTPIKKESTPMAGQEAGKHGVCSIGIIGGADGPTEMIWGTDSTAQSRKTYSSLHFKPIQDGVEWRIIFCIRKFKDAAFFLI